MITRFDRIHERDRQTNRRTPHDGIGRAFLLVIVWQKSYNLQSTRINRNDIQTADLIVPFLTRSCRSYTRRNEFTKSQTKMT